jgi:hypothetical protein
LTIQEGCSGLASTHNERWIGSMARPLRVEYAAGIAKAHCIYGYTLKEITAHFGVHYSTIGRRLHHYGASRDEPR